MYRKFSIAILVLISVVVFTGCAGRNGLGYKQFESLRGFTITADTSFEERGVLAGFDMLLESELHEIMITGARENMGIWWFGQLNEYANSLRSRAINAGHSNISEIRRIGHPTVYYYFTYTARIQNVDFKYMVIAKMGESYHFVFNFATLESRFAEHRQKFNRWAGQIIVS
ncbi:MAG: hypothetical protein FWE45_05230 [Firmicutes bacterium]|nr:hypothetical protein [Bacillota bacterium]